MGSLALVDIIIVWFGGWMATYYTVNQNLEYYSKIIGENQKSFTVHKCQLIVENW